MPQFDDIFQGPVSTEVPAATQGPSSPSKEAPDVEERETWFSQNIVLALLLVGAAYILVQGFWNSSLLAISQEGSSVEARFIQLSGMNPPPDYDQALYVNVVGRRVISFFSATDPVPSAVVLYYRGSLADGTSKVQMKDDLKLWLTEFGIPLEDGEVSQAVVGDEKTEIETFSIPPGGEARGSLILAPFTAADEKPAVLAVVGPRRQFWQLRRRYVD